jgi:hypothetical protein
MPVRSRCSPRPAVSGQGSLTRQGQPAGASARTGRAVDARSDGYDRVARKHHASTSRSEQSENRSAGNSSAFTAASYPAAVNTSTGRADVPSSMSRATTVPSGAMAP